MKESALTAGEMEKSGTQSGFGVLTGTEKAAFSLTGGSVKLHAACDDAFNEAKVIETLEKLKELADTAWKEFPESIPVQNAFGELVEEVMVKPFAEGRDVQEG